MNEGVYIKVSFIPSTCLKFLRGMKVYETLTSLRRVP